MIDIRLLREKPEEVRQAIGRKKFAVDFDGLLRADEARRSVIREAEETRARQNAANEEMASLAKGSPEFLEKVGEMKALSAQAKELQARQAVAEEAFQSLMLSVPNLPHESVPDGKGEQDNVEVARWGDIEAGVSSAAVAHYDLPGIDRLIDLEAGNRITGAGWPVFVGPMARLERALVQFCLDEAAEAGYEEIAPPLLVNAASATATGQLPDKEGQMYEVPHDGLYLIPTAEVPVTNLLRDAILEADSLPVARCAYTPCFRREAGSHGKDVRGLNRVHQFDKVELVKWVHPDQSEAELEKLRADAENLLRKLELPYRVLSICAGDIGFPHSRQYDLEVWAAGQQRWLEVSSCSNFTDFQARRANIRFREKGGKPQIVHTLNGSALGLARTLVAILENNVAEGGRAIHVPAVLRKWFGGDRLEL